MNVSDCPVHGDAAGTSAPAVRTPAHGIDDGAAPSESPFSVHSCECTATSNMLGGASQIVSMIRVTCNGKQKNTHQRPVWDVDEAAQDIAALPRAPHGVRVLREARDRRQLSLDRRRRRRPGLAAVRRIGAARRAAASGSNSVAMRPRRSAASDGDRPRGGQRVRPSERSERSRRAARRGEMPDAAAREVDAPVNRQRC